MRNHSIVPEFVLLGLSAGPQTQALLFVLFLVIYLLTVMGNLLLLLVVNADSCFHTPMYFFLGQLSFLDLCHSSVTVPKLLENLLSEKKTISVEGCTAQVFFVFATGGTESCLLAVMAYDHYVAISSPLLYGQVMNRQLCAGLVGGSWGLAFLDALINILVALNLDFCEAENIHHFSCELPSLYPLSCSDVSASFTTLLCSSILHFLGNVLMIFLSYICILSTEDQLHYRQKQSLLHLLLPPHCSDFLLWLWITPLSHAKFRIHSRVDLLLAVQRDHSHAESPHLQPEEQGGEGSCEKNIEKIFL
ncbi:hypothetical protein H8957_003411, partial [Semnopithecus entellus]